MLSGIVPALILLFWFFRWLGQQKPGGWVGDRGSFFAQQPTRITWHSIGVIFVLLPFAAISSHTVNSAIGLDAQFSVFVGLFVGGLLVPHWMAWRVLGPWGWVRLGHFVLLMAPRLLEQHYVGSIEVFVAAFGGGAARPWRWWSDPWSLFALALRARNDQAWERMQLLRQLLERYPDSGTPRRLRSQGWELLAWSCIDAGRWEEALLLLRRAKGRGARLLTSLVEARQTATKPSRWLWFLWGLSPYRRRAWAAVRDLSAGRREQGGTGLESSTAEVEPSADPALAVGLLHLDLLARAGRGKPLSAAAVMGLAGAWDEAFAPERRAELIRRGLELSAPEPSTVVDGLVESLLRDLESLGRAVEPPWPESPSREGFCGYLLRHRADYILAELDPVVEPWRQGSEDQRAPGPSLCELELWLDLRVAVEQLARVGGDDSLINGWYDGVRYAACNWPVSLMRARGDTITTWVCREMCRWCEGVALRVGDEEILEVVRGNLGILASR